MARGMQPYVDAIAGCRAQFPELDQLLQFAQQPTRCQPRVSLLEFTASGTVREQKIDRLAQLYEYWQTTTNTGINGRLYVVEDLSPEYLEALGNKFRVHPGYFLKYLYLPIFLKGDGHSLNSRLPLQPASSVNSNIRTGMSLRYYDLVMDRPSFVSTNVTRKSVRTSPLLNGEFITSTLRNASLYVEPPSPGEPWFALMMVDAPSRGRQGLASISKSSNDFWSTDIFAQTKRTPKPSADAGLFDSITEFWTHRATPSDIDAVNQSPEDSLASFAAKAVTPSWLIVLEFISGLLSHSEYSTYEFENMNPNDSSPAKIREELTELRRALAIVNRTRRRILWYIDHVRINLQALGYPVGLSELQLSSAGSQNTTKTGTDEFAIIHSRLLFTHARAESLLPVVLGTCSILGAQQSGLEAKQVSMLTSLAALFIPITTAAAIFSMSDEYLPGATRFWIFWAVAVPLVIVVVLAMYRLVWAWEAMKEVKARMKMKLAK
ncbi:hypothetical protein AJ79_03755 [Helicocarpus griseus UAMH5409]|uniref:Uncharacterized protein n=1 Tax=Helicocarpus griseus UAMH5409 TaxID=1447875 RepID=A0A2B7XXP8_9EURO|nr:hypothetical protein AJ79_03755 [Helicocarpus griseus UAMH5409]